MKPTIKVMGFEQIKRNLAKLARLTNRDVIEDALMEGAEVIAEAARDFVPVRTGNLRASIGISVSEGGMNFAGGSVSKGSVQVFIGPMQGKDQPHNGFYGHMVEFGTAKMAAQPFMRPAFDAQAQKASDTTIMYIADEFNRLTKG